jgi:16S rRNA processing protein RimM
MADHPRFLLLGQILRPHGIQGELKIRVLTDYPERIGELETVYLGEHPDDDAAENYQVQRIRPQNEYGLLKLGGIDTREEADTLRQLYVMVALEDAVPLAEGEFYLYQLIGLRVQTDDGQNLGTLSEVLETGANHVYIVDSPQYGEVLIPALENTILKTDIETGIVVVRLPEGTLPGK